MTACRLRRRQGGVGCIARGAARRLRLRLQRFAALRAAGMKRVALGC
jgi:hypothetical protein